jgi:hypothetical protein
VLDTVALRLARLRGRLPAEALGARGLERVARNPACRRLRALTLASVTPATAAAAVYGEPAPEGQSPFALGAGTRFERALFEDGAGPLALAAANLVLGPRPPRPRLAKGSDARWRHPRSPRPLRERRGPHAVGRG